MASGSKKRKTRTTKRSTSRKPAPAPLDIRTCAITLQLAGYPDPLRIEPEIRHTLTQEWPGAVAAGCFPDIGGLPHRFDLVIRPDTLAFELGRHDPYDRRTADEWLDLMADYALASPEVLTEDAFVAARLEAQEYPVHMVNYGAGWYACLDGGGNAGLWYALGRWGPRQEGSLFWLKTLGVHPRLRGQQLGLYLTAHALWELHRTSEDLAVLEVGTPVTIYGKPEDEPKRRGGLRKLARYYERLGFTSLGRSKDEFDLMCLPLDLCAMPVLGLGELSPPDEDASEDES